MEYLVKKDLVQDQATGLDQRVVITQLTIDAISEIISVCYRIETLSPTGVVVAKSEPMTFTRHNAEGNMKFNQLKASQLGQGIIGMLQADIDGYPDLEQD